MSLRGHCLYYKGVEYGPGTKVKMKYFNRIVEETYIGGGHFTGLRSNFNYTGIPAENYIVEIVEPVYYQPPQPDPKAKSSIWTRPGSGSPTASEDIFHGLLLYIVVMVLGTIFNDRWLIWISATIIYFNWKEKK